ncbi:related to vacuolar ATP synthase subunit H [Pseudozyma flocculosa]|uniref:Related to vacuolar ATP synthase subunit H n=1 Tax=Pseudozyma flocculosa TaxID=84751 RepID=A0A5C3F791_9BASI|nr:related to vacuolar ATP synthase subunit H [Pseudozyma flocculosa]
MSSSNAAQADQQQGSDKKQRETVEAPPLVHLTNKWIQQLTGRIRSRPIPWEGYHRADLLSAEELKMIKSVDAVVVGGNRSKLDPLLDQHGPSRDDRIELFLSLDGQEVQDGVGFPWRPFVKLLDVPDDFVQLKAAHFLTLLLVFSASRSSQPKATASVLPRLLTFLTSLLQGALSQVPAQKSAQQTQKQQQQQQQQQQSASSSGQGNSNGGDSGDAQGGEGAPSPAARRLSPDYAEGNGPEIALVLLEALLRAHSYRKEVWREEVRRLGNASSTKAGGDGSEGDHGDDAAAAAGSERGLLPELVHMLRFSMVRPDSARNSNFASPAGSGATTPSRHTTATTATSAASTLVAGALTNNGSSGSSSERASTQLVYQIVLCLWLLSFDDDIAAEINVKYGVVPVLYDVARNAVKEKVIRVTVATLKNLLSKAPEANASAMLGSKLLPLSENLIARKWSDEEIEEDLSFIRDDLAHRLKGMSTFDEYLSELSSGKLTHENPAHELDDFWRENAPKFVERDGEVLKQLVEVLEQSDEPETLAVACSDVGKFVQFFEQGKKRVTELGAKARIMQLMSSDDNEVRLNALHTVSRLVSASWR